ncbi:hypothetical protein AMTR_s00034p00229260, partial [Amborella trichopoda]
WNAIYNLYPSTSHRYYRSAASLATYAQVVASCYPLLNQVPKTSVKGLVKGVTCLVSESSPQERSSLYQPLILSTAEEVSHPLTVNHQRLAPSDVVTLRSTRPYDNCKSRSDPRRPWRKSRSPPSAHIAPSPPYSPPHPATSLRLVDHCADVVWQSSHGNGNKVGPQRGIVGGPQVEGPSLSHSPAYSGLRAPSGSAPRSPSVSHTVPPHTFSRMSRVDKTLECHPPGVSTRGSLACAALPSGSVLATSLSLPPLPTSSPIIRPALRRVDSMATLVMSYFLGNISQAPPSLYHGASVSKDQSTILESLGTSIEAVFTPATLPPPFFTPSSSPPGLSLV